VPRHEKKGDAVCHISENAQSIGLGRYSKTKKIYREKIKNDLYYRKAKVY